MSFGTFSGPIIGRFAHLQPWLRGEWEITAVNNAYVAAGDLHYDILGGWWTGVGQFESLLHPSPLVATQRAKHRK